jgi:solute carrier family 35 (UDP-sugar transporter), member A1/2/3
MSIKENNTMFSKNAMSLKTIILVSLCLQNAGYTLLRKYSTSYEDVSSKEILFVSEVIKLLFSLYMILNPVTGPTGLPEEHSDAPGTGFQKVQWLLLHSQKMFVLALIYAAMNILSFVALQYIGAGEFTICAQLKILTTAASSVLVLKASLSWTKWRALVLLVLGCILVASPSFTGGHNSGSSTSLALQLYGYAAVLTEVVLSGFASTYFEKVVKSTTEVITIWERNFQLGVYSLLMYGVIMLYESSSGSGTSAEGAAEATRAAWSHWSAITVAVAVLGATGGLLVAATLKYADSILKTLAAAGAIVLSTVLGHYFLSGPLDIVVSVGALVTIVAIGNYTFDMQSTSSAS